VLGDSAESPRFVETLPRRGYRFIGELEPPVQPVVPVVTVEADRAFLSRRRVKMTTGVLAISVFAIAALVAYRWFRHQRPQEQAAFNVLPFTALPGEETSAAFSPDGSRIAFAWNGDPPPGVKGFDLYVKALGSETLLRLTHHPSEWISPAWSPDGTQIAFHRMDGADTGIYVVPALGGPERKVRSTQVPHPVLSIISWSPDAKWIAFSDMPGDGRATMYLLSTETLESKRLPITPKCINPGEPAFSHRGDHLAYWCLHSMDEFGLYSLPLPDGPPKMISLFRPFPLGLTWSGDDRSLIYSLSGELSEVTVANGSIKRLDFAGSAELPTVSFKGDQFAYSSSSDNSDIWRRDLLQPESPAVRLAPSTRAQRAAQFSPDGKLIAFESSRSGVQGVWVSSHDGGDLVQISNLHDLSGNPQWSPDGKKIAFDSRPVDRREIYIADLSERIPRKLVTNISDAALPHWSRDGKWIYFMSSEVGKTGIYRCPASGGDAIALSKSKGNIDGTVAQESFDGDAVFFASRFEKPTLKKVPLSALPATALEVEGLPRLSEGVLWTLSRGGIYFVPRRRTQISPLFRFLHPADTANL